jgi:hypothetical protein
VKKLVDPYWEPKIVELLGPIFGSKTLHDVAQLDASLVHGEVARDVYDTVGSVLRHYRLADWPPWDSWYHNDSNYARRVAAARAARHAVRVAEAAARAEAQRIERERREAAHLEWLKQEEARIAAERLRYEIESAREREERELLAAEERAKKVRGMERNARPSEGDSYYVPPSTARTRRDVAEDDEYSVPDTDDPIAVDMFMRHRR